MKFNVETADWYMKPEMNGHIWAKNMVAYFKAWWNKNVKTENQMALAVYCLRTNSTDWHYWCSYLSKKSLSQLQYVLRRLGKESYVNLLNHLNWTSGCLKDELTWWLELKSYETDPNTYFNTIYFPAFRFYGMSRSDCLARFHKYHTELREKHSISA